MALVMETRPAAYAVIIEQGKLLMTRWVPEDRAQSPLWSLPGGGMEPGEQADETAPYVSRCVICGKPGTEHPTGRWCGSEQYVTGDWTDDPAVNAAARAIEAAFAAEAA